MLGVLVAMVVNFFTKVAIQFHLVNSLKSAIT